MKGHGLFGECRILECTLSGKQLKLMRQKKKATELGSEPDCRRAEPKKLNFVLWV